MKKIAFILSTFPTLTETFVAGELKILMERFPGSQIFSLRQPFDKKLHEESVYLMQKTHYVDPICSSAVLNSNLHWITKRPGRFFKTLLYVAIHTILNPPHFLKTLYIYPKAVYLASLIETHQIDHIHSHWAGYSTTAALIISKLLRIPYSFTSHACDMSMIRTFMKEKVQQSRFVVTCTADALRFLSTFLSYREMRKINVNYHGSNLEKFRPELRRPNEIGKPLILSCADLHERKGFPYLLQSLAILKGRNVNFQCVIVGEGPQRRLLETMISELELQGLVTLPGSVTQEKLIEDYYALSDLFVLPCVIQHLNLIHKNVDLSRTKILECKISGGEGIQKDGIPNVLVEAMAMKIPVISTEVAGIPELIKHKRNGLLAPERDPEALAKLIESLLRDKRLRERIGQKGYEFVHERFDRRKNIKELIQIFEKNMIIPDNEFDRLHNQEKLQMVSLPNLKN